MQNSNSNGRVGSAQPNSNEIFDVVNNNDEVIDQQPRHIVHEKNLLHRAVHALVYDDSNRLYLQKRSLSKDTNPGLWDTSMGGHLETGESYDQAAIRETFEELGILLENAPEKLFKLQASKNTGYEFIWVYKIIHSGRIQPCQIEISEGRWIDCDELSRWMSQTPELFTSTLSYILNKCEQLD